MASFIVGIIGYGLAIIFALGGFGEMSKWADTPDGSRLERACFARMIVGFVGAILLAVGTHWFIRLVL